MNPTNASFAAPSTGGAVSETRTRPSESTLHAFRDARGWTLTDIVADGLFTGISTTTTAYYGTGDIRSRSTLLCFTPDTHSPELLLTPLRSPLPRFCRNQKRLDFG